MGGNFLLPTYSTGKRVDLSWLNTKSYVMGFLTWPESSLFPCMCMAIPSYTQAVPCRQLIPSWPFSSRGVPPHQTIHWCFHRTHKISKTFLSGTSGRKGRKTFTTCVSWTLMRPLTSVEPQRSTSREKIKKKTKISGGIPSLMPSFIILCMIGWWSPGRRSQGNSEVDSESPDRKLSNVWIS